MSIMSFMREELVLIKKFFIKFLILFLLSVIFKIFF
jgi:hypothetical protein